MSNLLDNLIGFFSPLSKARRLCARLALAEAEKNLRKYEGASRGNRTKGWHTTGTSANAEITPSLSTLRNRSRDLVRNNCHAKRGMAVIRTNTVGTGIITQINGRSSKKAKVTDALFDAWAESTAIDYDRRHDIYGLQNIVIGTVAESGECLIRRRTPSSSDAQGVPLQLQILECDHLDSGMAPQQTANGNTIVQGIEFDTNGHRVAYHISENHPGESGCFCKFKVNRIPASEILHVYDMARPGQVRGVPWLAPAIIKLRDLDEFEDAQLIRQKIAACFAAFVHGDDISGGGFAQSSTLPMSDRLEPGAIEHLPPGKEITFGAPPGVVGYQEYITTHLRAIASALGVTYEAMTGDFSNVNFSSGRMGWIEFQRNITDWQQRLMVSQFLRPLWQWFAEAASIVGYDVSGLCPDFTMPRREMIDPVSEIKAIAQGIRSGLITLPQAIKANGGDPAKQLEEIAATNDQLDRFGITLDTDPRKGKTGGEKEDVANDKKNAGS